MNKATDHISPFVPRFPLVREQLVSWKLMPNKNEWRLAWQKEAHRLRAENVGFRYRAYVGVCLVAVSVVAGSFGFTSYQVLAIMVFSLCMVAAYCLGRINMRIIDNAIFQRWMTAVQRRSADP